jgi:hypothetical protein
MVLVLHGIGGDTLYMGRGGSSMSATVFGLVKSTESGLELHTLGEDLIETGPTQTWAPPQGIV